MTQLPTLSVVIPAFNEEQSIGAIIQRCLDARERIRQVGEVGVVEIIVVNDGSTDRTGVIARGWTDRESAVRLVTFPTNRGYGAAIQEGFARSSGDLLAFLDADGTCDPNYFGELCHALQTGQAVMALGSRVATGTRMPWVRRIGNAAYAVLVSALSGPHHQGHGQRHARVEAGGPGNAVSATRWVALHAGDERQSADG
jgi:glycosyltransferase involved in cell wall biosynthesis